MDFDVVVDDLQVVDVAVATTTNVDVAVAEPAIDFDVVVDDVQVVDVTIEPQRQLDFSVEESVYAVINIPGPVGPRGPVAQFRQELLNVNGSRTVFTLSDPALQPENIQVYRNGLLEIPGLCYQASSTTVTFPDPPLITDTVVVSYQIAN